MGVLLVTGASHVITSISIIVPLIARCAVALGCDVCEFRRLSVLPFAFGLDGMAILLLTVVCMLLSPACLLASAFTNRCLCCSM